MLLHHVVFAWLAKCFKAGELPDFLLHNGRILG
jgi:hypothetical protein